VDYADRPARYLALLRPCDVIALPDTPEYRDEWTMAKSLWN